MPCDLEYNMLIITCGGLTKDFPIVKQCLPESATESATGFTKEVEVDGRWRVGFNIKSCADDLSGLKENCDSTDAYIIFYDTTRPKAVSIYDSFIRNIIGTKGKAVRVVGIQPLSRKRSIKRKSQKSKSISTGWGSYHRVVISKIENSIERREIYRSIGAELIESHEMSTTAGRRLLPRCTIL